jgi:disulfide bond formation protein DsbB
MKISSYQKRLLMVAAGVSLLGAGLFLPSVFGLTTGTKLIAMLLGCLGTGIGLYSAALHGEPNS